MTEGELADEWCFLAILTVAFGDVNRSTANPGLINPG